MANKYDAAEAKKRRLLFWVLLIAGVIGFVLTPKLIVPTTSLEENLLVFVRIVFCLETIIAGFGLVVNFFAELDHAK